MQKNLRYNSRLMRFLVTLALLAVFRAVAVLPLPGIDTGNLNLMTGSAGLSVMALGISPFVVAFVAVELLSFILPMARQLRRGGIAGRRKLNAFAVRAGVAWALVQGSGIAVALQRQSQLVRTPGLLFTLSCMMTLAAGAILAFLIARLISRWGIGNGFCLIIGLDLIWRAAAEFRDVLSSEAFWNPLEFLVWMAAIGLLVRTFARRPGAVLRGFQQEAIPISLPAFPQGIPPVTWTYSLLTSFSTLKWIFPGVEQASRSPAAFLSATILMAALSIAAFHLFSSCKRLVWNLPSDALPKEGDVWTGRLLAQSTTLLVGFGAGFLGGNWFLDFRFAGVLGFPALVILVALGFDLVAEWSFRQRHGDKVEPLIELDNIYCACYLAGLLANNRTDSLVRSFHFRSLTFFLGPIVKMELIVPAAELERAREIIRLDRIEMV